MRVSSFGARQRSLPKGPLAPLTARALNRCNQALIRHCIDALGSSPGDRVLDVGFGGGISLRLLLDQSEARVFAVEPSGEMVRRASRVFAREVRDGRLVVRRAGVEAMPFGDCFFDRIMTVQTIYFWPDTSAALAEIHRVMAPGGRLAVGIMPEAAQLYFGFPKRGHKVFGPDDVAAALSDASFVPMTCRTMSTAANGWGGPSVVVGKKPQLGRVPAGAGMRVPPVRGRGAG